jgi:predicted translin family RNA/ssDNA-binding protein
MPKPIKSPSNVNAATKGIASSAVTVGIELAGEVAKLAIEAIMNDDPKTLKKVTDILPAGHKLRSEITYAVEMERLRKKFAGEKE